MNEAENSIETSRTLQRNIILRNLIIQRERRKALHANLSTLRQKQLEKPALLKTSKEALQKENDLNIKAAHFAFVRQRLTHALTAWKNNKNTDLFFIRIENRRGATYHTFNKDAERTAKILGLKPQKIRLNNRQMQCVSIPERKMQQTIDLLSQRDLKAAVINMQGEKVPISRKRNASPSISATTAIQKPKIDIMESLDRNRQDSRRTSIHVENLSVHCDSKGNWKVSGLVNGQTVTAKPIQQEDAFSYKKGEITGEQLATKYQLQDPPKRQNAVTKKNAFTRRYSLDSD